MEFHIAGERADQNLFFFVSAITADVRRLSRIHTTNFSISFDLVPALLPLYRSCSTSLVKNLFGAPNWYLVRATTRKTGNDSSPALSFTMNNFLCHQIMVAKATKTLRKIYNTKKMISHYTQIFISIVKVFVRFFSAWEICN